MRHATRLALTTLIATLLLGAAVSIASAGQLTTSTQSIRVTWTNLEFVSAVTVRCPVTLAGSFTSRTIRKVGRLLIGAITAASVNQAGCSGGTIATFNGSERFNGGTTSNTLPWHITFEGFLGTLPNITAIDLLLARLRFGLAASVCSDGQYGTTTDNVTTEAYRESRGAILGLYFLSNRSHAHKFAGGIFCPFDVHLSQTGTLSESGRISVNVTITLI